uniref:Uncharacterized protein n=1 Tax=Romanomermis culicivorax TaxID=13658 RepID=A0A915ICD7_ROMCU
MDTMKSSVQEVRAEANSDSNHTPSLCKSDEENEDIDEGFIARGFPALIFTLNHCLDSVVMLDYTLEVIYVDKTADLN